MTHGSRGDAPAWTLATDAFGRLMLAWPGEAPQEVVPVRAFPIEAPDVGIALVDGLGREVAWIERLDDLPRPLRTPLDEALASRDFMPVIEAIDAVSGVATPCTWTVRTDRGPATLRLKSEQDIRRIAGGRLLVMDADGVSFLIQDPGALDRGSRRALDYFL